MNTFLLLKRTVIIITTLSFLLSCEKDSIVNTVNSEDSNDSNDIEETTTIKRLSRSKNHLAPDGILVLEINEQLGYETAALFASHGFATTLHSDFRSKTRMLTATINRQSLAK